MFYLLASKCVTWLTLFLSFQFLLYAKLGTAHFIFRIRKLKRRDSRRLVSGGGFSPRAARVRGAQWLRHDVQEQNNAADAQGGEALTYHLWAHSPAASESRSPSPRGAHGPADGRRAPHQPCTSTSLRNPGNRQFSSVRGLSHNSVPGRKRGCKLIRETDPLIVLVLWLFAQFARWDVQAWSWLHWLCPLLEYGCIKVVLRLEYLSGPAVTQ